MKKALMLLLTFMLLVFLFSACEDDEPDTKKRKSTVSVSDDSDVKKSGTVSATKNDDVASANEDNEDEQHSSTVSESKNTVSESKPKQPKKEDAPIEIGETVVTQSCEFTLNDVVFSYDVKPESPPTYYRHYPASVGQVFIYVDGTVKNTGKQDLSCDEIYSVEVDYNEGYKYTGFNAITESDGDFGYANINSVNPLQIMGVHCLVDCPEEVETSDAPVVLTFNFKTGEKYTYKMR